MDTPLSLEQADNAFVRLLLERANYETELYDFLVSPLIVVPQTNSSFWDPVVVCLNQDQLQLASVATTCELTECAICITDRQVFKKVKCCNQLICTQCANDWFIKSVYCPYCKRDLRELI